jgi:hypothetical protein
VGPVLLGSCPVGRALCLRSGRYITAWNGAFLDRCNLEQLSVEQLSVEQLSVEQLSVEQLSLEQLSVEQLSLEQFGLEQLSVEQFGLELILPWQSEQNT